MGLLVAQTIYVGNLLFRATAEDIRSAFSQFGQVTSVNIVAVDKGIAAAVEEVEEVAVEVVAEGILGAVVSEETTRGMIASLVFLGQNFDKTTKRASDLVARFVLNCEL